MYPEGLNIDEFTAEPIYQDRHGEPGTPAISLHEVNKAPEVVGSHKTGLPHERSIILPLEHAL